MPIPAPPDRRSDPRPAPGRRRPDAQLRLRPHRARGRAAARHHHRRDDPGQGAPLRRLGRGLRQGRAGEPQAIVGQGTRFDPTLRDSASVDLVPTDSVVGLESFAFQVDAAADHRSQHPRPRRRRRRRERGGGGHLRLLSHVLQRQRRPRVPRGGGVLLQHRAAARGAGRGPPPRPARPRRPRAARGAQRSGRDALLQPPRPARGAPRRRRVRGPGCEGSPARHRRPRHPGPGHRRRGPRRARPRRPRGRAGVPVVGPPAGRRAPRSRHRRTDPDAADPWRRQRRRRAPHAQQPAHHRAAVRRDAPGPGRAGHRLAGCGPRADAGHHRARRLVPARDGRSTWRSSRTAPGARSAASATRGPSPGRTWR